MKTLIFQVKIGEVAGYVYGFDNAPNLFEKHLMPTVQRYCNKHGYDYLEITDFPKDHECTWFNYSGEKNKASTLVRYLSMNKEYDRIVSLDNDIWIPEHAEPLPDIDGHYAVIDQYAKTFVNGGVQMVDRKTGKLIYQHFANICKDKTPPINGHWSDQSYLNHWRSLNTKSSHLLDKKWNYMVSCHKRSSNYENANFIHYAGRKSRPLLIEDISKGIIQ
jgi:hypothetical protein